MTSRIHARIPTLLFLILPLVTLGGCASVDSMMASWMGHHQSELIASWGPPQRTASDGAGGTVLIYLEYRSQVGRTGSVLGALTAGGSVAERMFYVNADGIIYRWRWRGL